MKWVTGRQSLVGNEKYYKFKIWEWLGTDCWLLKFEPNCMIPIHRDKVEGKDHYRLNIVIKKGGGNFYVDTHIMKWWRIILFRPDLVPHTMLNGNTTRITLSIGFTTKKES